MEDKDNPQKELRRQSVKLQQKAHELQKRSQELREEKQVNKTTKGKGAA